MWVLPTRSRTENCQRFIEAWHTTNASTPVHVRLDLDDPSLEILKSLPWPKEFTVFVGPRGGLRQAINEIFELYPNEAWYGLLADDLLPQTNKWDQLLIEAAGSNQIAYPNDGGKLLDLPTHPCVGGNLVRSIGWFGFPPCYHFFVDTVWQFLGKQLNNIHRLDNVIVEHLHYSLGKSAMDQTYQESSEKYKNDKRAYRDWCESDGKLLIARLQNDIY